MPALPTTALLALTPLSGALPLLTDALLWAEVVHEALVKLSDEGGEVGSPESFTGRDAHGEPLAGHRHASVLPLAGGGDGRVDQVLVDAPMGLDARARGALARLSKVWAAPGAATLRVELVGLGLRDELADRVPALRTSATWTSVTPFVPPRHLKARGRSALEDQVQAELGYHGLPRASRVEVETGSGFVPAAGFWALWRPDEPGFPDDGNTLATRWRRFRLARQEHARRPPVRAGFGLRLGFDAPVPGPLALGYASHFGLGLLGPG